MSNPKVAKIGDPGAAMGNLLHGSRVCHQYFLSNRQPPFICQFVLPKNLTSLEAARLCAFIRTLASDFKAHK